VKGGEEVIRKWRPKLAISLYHRWEELFSILLWPDGLKCGYRFFSTTTACNERKRFSTGKRAEWMDVASLP